jgi:hypothetical protein
MMSFEEKAKLARAATEARTRGDIEEAEKLLAMLPLSLWAARCAVQTVGVEGLEEAKRYGLNFSDVEEQYGPRWYEHA